VPALARVGPVEAFLAHLHAAERSPNTVRAYGHDLRDWYEFCDRSGLVWSGVRLEDVGRFVAWLRLAPGARNEPNVVAVPTSEPAGCSEATVSRKLSAVSAFYEFHQRHGVDLGDLLTTWQRRGSGGGSWRPLLAHLGSRPERTRRIRLRAEKHLPSTLDEGQVATVLASCKRLRDRMLFTLLAESGLRMESISRNRTLRIGSKVSLPSSRRRSVLPSGLNARPVPHPMCGRRYPVRRRSARPSTIRPVAALSRRLA